MFAKSKVEFIYRLYNNTTLYNALCFPQYLVITLKQVFFLTTPVPLWLLETGTHFSIDSVQSSKFHSFKPVDQIVYNIDKAKNQPYD